MQYHDAVENLVTAFDTSWADCAVEVISLTYLQLRTLSDAVIKLRISDRPDLQSKEMQVNPGPPYELLSWFERVNINQTNPKVLDYVFTIKDGPEEITDDLYYGVKNCFSYWRERLNVQEPFRVNLIVVDMNTNDQIDNVQILIEPE